MVTSSPLDRVFSLESVSVALNSQFAHTQQLLEYRNTAYYVLKNPFVFIKKQLFQDISNIVIVSEAVEKLITDSCWNYLRIYSTGI